MIQILTTWLAAISDKEAGKVLRFILGPIVNRFRSCTLSTAGLVIFGAASPVVKTGAAVTHFIAEGVKGRIAASTNMPLLVGTVANAKFNVFVFSVDKASAVTVQMGVEGVTEAAIRWPKLDQRKAIVGFIIVNPTGAGDFVGNTTALDSAGVVPNVAFISPTGTFDPSVLTGDVML